MQTIVLILFFTAFLGLILLIRNENHKKIKQQLIKYFIHNQN